MGLMDGLKTGLMLQDYLDNNAQKQEEAKLKTQLYGSQAKHLDAQSQLLTMQVQRQQAFQEGLPQALQTLMAGGGAGTMTGPTPEEQTPSFVGPQAPPTLPRPAPAAQSGGAPAVDPQEKLLDFMSARALGMQMFDEYAKLQQAKIERRKVYDAQRDEDIQNRLKFLQDTEANSPDPKIRGQAQNAQIALLLQAGKSGDALKLLERLRGAPTSVQPGAQVVNTPEMGDAEVRYTNPNRPVVVGLEQQLYQPPTPGKGGAPTSQATPISPPPTPGTRSANNTQADLNIKLYGVNPPPAGQPQATAEMLREAEESGRIKGGLKPAGATGPPAGYGRFLIQNQDGTAVLGGDGKPGFVDVPVGDLQGLKEFQDKFPTYRFVPAPAPVGGRAQLAGDAERERLAAQAGTPGASRADVTAADEQARRNVAVYGAKLPPQGKPNATAAMAAAAEAAARLEQEGVQPANPQSPVAQQREASQLRAQGIEPNNPQRPVPGQRTAAEFEAGGLQPYNPTRPVAGQQRQAVQNAEAGFEGATQGDVAAEVTQKRLNVELWGSPTPPPSQPNATQIMLDAAKTGTQAPPDVVTHRINAMLHADRVAQAMQAVPEVDQERYIGLLRRPRAQLESLFADIGTAAKGDAQMYTFLANASDLFYTLARPDVGANYTVNEKEILANVYPSEGVKTYTQFKASLDRLRPFLQQKMADEVKMVGATRATLGDAVRERQGATPTPKATTPTTPESPRDQANRLLKERGLPPLPGGTP